MDMKFMDINEYSPELKRFPEKILNKIEYHGNEYCCRQQDFIEILTYAKNVPMACIGGQIQYQFNDATCELWWENYDSAERKQNENWKDYCNRTVDECIKIFNVIINTVDFKEEAKNSFEYLKNKIEQGYDIEKNKMFMLYFDDSETDNYK